jgi:ribosome-associated protein
LDDEDDIYAGPSKSQQKRDMLKLQRLGEELVGLPEKQLASLDIPERLRDAIELARRITSHGALKRQRQYIGRLMRDVDPAPLRAALERFQGADQATKAHFQECERWRDRLLAEGDGALVEFLERHPQADRPHLRRLVREAMDETAAGRPPRHARVLFRYIHSLDQP